MFDHHSNHRTKTRGCWAWWALSAHNTPPNTRNRHRQHLVSKSKICQNLGCITIVLNWPDLCSFPGLPLVKHIGLLCSDIPISEDFWCKCWCKFGCQRGRRDLNLGRWCCLAGPFSFVVPGIIDSLSIQMLGPILHHGFRTGFCLFPKLSRISLFSLGVTTLSPPRPQCLTGNKHKQKN